MNAPTRRMAAVAWAGLLATPVLFVGVTLAAAPPRGMRSPELSGMFFWMAAAVAGLGLALSRLLPPRIRASGGGPRDAVAFTRLLVAWAILEGAAMFPLVAELVTGDATLYVVSAVPFLALALLIPTQERWDAYAVQPLDSPGPDRRVR